MRVTWVMKLALLVFAASLPGLALAQTPTADTQVPLTFAGGHETYGPDRGRPVVLIAAALKVTPEVFRDAFSRVKPAPAGESPQEDQVRKNKANLMAALGKYGVTDERLNEVSNYYRYRRDQGRMWPTTPAKGFATIHNGEVAGYTITDIGSGYSSPPQVSIAGRPDSHLVGTLSFDTDFKKNGAVSAVSVGMAPAPTDNSNATENRPPPGGDRPPPPPPVDH